MPSQVSRLSVVAHISPPQASETSVPVALGLGKPCPRSLPPLSTGNLIYDAPRFFWLFLKMFVVKKFQVCREMEKCHFWSFLVVGLLFLWSRSLQLWAASRFWWPSNVSCGSEWQGVSSKALHWLQQGELYVACCRPPSCHLAKNWTGNLQLNLFSSSSTPILHVLVSPLYTDAFELVIQFGAYNLDYIHHLSLGRQDSGVCFLTSPLTTTTRVFSSSNLP